MSQLRTSLLFNNLLGAQKLCDMIECHKRVTSVTRRSFAMVWAIRGIHVSARAKMRGFSAALQTAWDTWDGEMLVTKVLGDNPAGGSCGTPLLREQKR